MGFKKLGKDQEENQKLEEELMSLDVY
jgi:hypothetical protein